MVKKTFIITSELGVQARPAAQLVNLASQFSANISIEYKGKNVNLKSIMGVMSLAVVEGSEITITAEGKDEQEALQQIEVLIEEEIGGALLGN
ncbi:phosphocarrier protein HPr [Ureibacillus sp. GCM10028918]|uniref:phosphocarrier protein HPr n=1 Tax=Ureibacillus sp. GCM10028918 TaxID=3273429 RepID=UPI00360E8394